MIDDTQSPVVTEKTGTVKPIRARRPSKPRSRSAVSEGPTPKATVHYLKSSQTSRMADRIEYLADRVRDGEVHGMTYVITDQNGDVQVGRVGLHRQNKAIAIGTMLQAAVALVMDAR